MEEIDSKAIRHAAMGLLARREHSDLELQQKLSYRFPDEAERVRVEVEQLTAEGLQSNTRLAESVIRTRISRGQGPFKIIHVLSCLICLNSCIYIYIYINIYIYI